MAFAVLTTVSCGATEPAASPASSAEPTSAPPATSPPAQGEPEATPSPTAPPEFSAKVSAVSRDRLPYSWRPGCPVHYRDLRLVRLSYWGFDDAPHTGELVVRKTVTDDITTVFRKLYDWRWPIQQMKLVDAFKADDYASIDANNTSAFNCRNATGSSNWSNHAYGAAIDINPRQNPYVTASGSTAHKNAEKFTKRPMKGKGVINPGDKVVKAFAAVGWEWGGYWSGTKDLQHFSKGGG
ncbi:M15 family metallopeptidase [Actinomadura sp. ATCC 31491]|uniref:M15 family metallopeptidase n=1 Tax=Actinomadura luzonensis TaxID=2805427 RepID=A0ABT0FPZ4_9ACTN|nr:M15 family metallopeptidase [Actinomadura luzonensis]MCK2214419.1 M15 family metallopeptidase [Actinomadura luzonensis]